MTRIALVLLALAPLLATPGTFAQTEAQTSYTLIADFEDGQYVWELDGQEENNPTLTVPGSTDITITIRQSEASAGVPHNIQVGGGEASEYITDAGDEVTYTFTSPPSGTVEYVCVVHPTTMVGTVQVAGGGEGSNTADGGGGGGGDGGEDTPGPGTLAALVAMVGAALLVTQRRRD